MAAAGFSKDTDLKILTKPVRDRATEKGDFQRFVYVFSSLMKDEVKEELASFFKIHDENTGGKFSGDNVAFCNLMKQRGIISPSSIEPLKDALRQCHRQHISNIAADMFTLYKEGKLGVSTTEKKDKAGFKVFLELLSLLIKEEVKRELESVFDTYDANVSCTFHGDNVAFCNVLEKKGIISPMSIRPLRTALRKGTIQIAYVADKFFTLFTDGHLDSLNTFEEEKEESFKQLLIMLSSLMTLDVQESLKSVFDISEEHVGDTMRGSIVAICNFMKEKKIISPSSIQPLIIVLTVCRQRSAAKRASEMFSLFEQKSPDMSIIVKEEEDFQGFVYVLSSLMKDEVKQDLASFFKIHKENTGGKFIGDNVAFCNLMKQRGIINTSNIKPLEDALRQCDKQHISNVAAAMFTLFKERRLDVFMTEEKDKVGFKVFLEMLSLLMKEEVKRGLQSVFDLSDAEASWLFSGDNVPFCNVLKEKGIVSPMSIRPLKTALLKGNAQIADVVDKFFTLFTDGHFDSLNTFEEEKEVSFKRLLHMLSLLMTQEVQEALLSVFDISEEHNYKIRGSNAAFWILMKEKKVISARSIQPLIIVLTECRQRGAAKLAREIFLLFKKKSLHMWIAVKEEEEKEYQRFLNILSLLMKKEVKQNLKSLFVIPEVQPDGNFNGDNVAFCNHLREMGIISPLHIELLTITLREAGNENGAVFSETLFKVFKERRFQASKHLNEKGKGRDFQRFLNILSLLMTKKVKKGLLSFFDFPERMDGGKIHGDSIAFCNILKNEGIISPSYIELITIVMKAYATQPAINILDRAMKLFVEKSLDDPTTLKGKKEAEFQRFLDILSLLMTDEVKRKLELHFDFTEVQYFHKFEDHNAAICYLLRQKGIISHRTIELLTLSLQEYETRKVAEICNEIFRLFKGEKLCATANLEKEKEGDFQRFLDILSLLMTTRVKKGLELFFDFQQLQSGHTFEDNNAALCFFLRGKGVISHNGIEPLTIALKHGENSNVARICETLFQLFKEGKLGATTNLGKEEEDDFQRFLDTLSLLMTTHLKKRLELYVDFHQEQAGPRFEDNNTALCCLLREKGVISHNGIEALTIILVSTGNDSVARICESLFQLFKEGKFGATTNLEKENEAGFQKFMDILSLLMTDEVKKGLELFFDFTQGQSFHKFEDQNDAICYLLWKKGIISHTTIELLTLALQACGKCEVAETCNQLFQLFKGGKLSATTNLEEEKGIVK